MGNGPCVNVTGNDPAGSSESARTSLQVTPAWASPSGSLKALDLSLMEVESAKIASSAGLIRVGLAGSLFPNIPVKDRA